MLYTYVGKEGNFERIGAECDVPAALDAVLKIWSDQGFVLATAGDHDNQIIAPLNKIIAEGQAKIAELEAKLAAIPAPVVSVAPVEPAQPFAADPNLDEKIEQNIAAGGNGSFSNDTSVPPVQSGTETGTVAQ